MSNAKVTTTWNRSKGLLKIMQVNVGRGGVANDLALQYAFQDQCDILLIQEPWIGADLDRKMTKKHVKYQAYAPQEIWTERPRVISYIHQDLCGIQVEKRQDLAIEPSADLLILELKGKGLREPKVYITNAYNAPRGSEREGETAQVAMRSQILMQECNILAGDFNLHHNDWAHTQLTQFPRPGNLLTE